MLSVFHLPIVLRYALVFHPPIFMISSTAVPANDLVTEPPTRKECIVKWSGNPAILRCPCSAAVMRCADMGTVVPGSRPQGPEGTGDSSLSPTQYYVRRKCTT